MRKKQKITYKILRKHPRQALNKDTGFIKVPGRDLDEFFCNLYCDSNVINQALSLIANGKNKIRFVSESIKDVEVYFDKPNFSKLFDGWRTSLIEIEDYETLVVIRDFEIPK